MTDYLLERVNGESLVVERNIRNWIKQLLTAITFLHSRNIVHLDISPESILIDVQTNVLKLSGFESSMIVDENIRYETNSELLSCCWQLPPIIRRCTQFDGFEIKSFDMWSVGVLTFLLLSAKFPFIKNKNQKRIPESQLKSALFLLKNE